jgi:hypothetical protein
MDQFASSTYVIQPGPATYSTRLTPNLSETSQSTIENNLVEKKRQPGAMNTPQIQSAFPTNVVQQSTSPPMAPHIATKGAGLPPSDPRRRKGKLLIFTAACMLIIAIIALLPLLPGLSSNASKSSIASGSETHLTTTSTLPTPTSTSLPKATAAASNPNAASTPSQTPTALPTLTPTTPTTTPPSGPGVTIANLTPSQCSTTNQGWTCTETLSEDQNNTSNLSWSASTGTAGVSFNPSSSTLSPGKTSQVNIAIPLSDCSDTFTFKGPIDSSNVTWNCALPAPTQLSPASGTVFNNYPRTTTLQWSAVPGAASYTVQIYYYQPGDTICSGGAQDYLTPNITNTSYTFEFVGAQPGCWRVWAVDAAGRQSSISGWWEFSYTV